MIISARPGAERACEARFSFGHEHLATSRAGFWALVPRNVMAGMLGPVREDEVVRAVVEPVVVGMVDQFVRLQNPAQLLGHDEAVFEDMPAFDGHGVVEPDPDVAVAARHVTPLEAIGGVAEPALQVLPRLPALAHGFNLYQGGHLGN